VQPVEFEVGLKKALGPNMTKRNERNSPFYTVMINSPTSPQRLSTRKNSNMGHLPELYCASVDDS